MFLPLLFSLLSLPGLAADGASPSGSSEDPPEASTEAREAACDGGDLDACTQLGAQYARGEGVPVDRFRASQLFRKACAGDHAHGCMFLAEAYRKGEGAGADTEKAQELYVKACELGDGLACRSVGDMYILGNLYGTDGRTAGLWYQMGCELGDGQACTGAGLWMERGDVMDADPDKAAVLFERGCQLGHARGCTMIGIRYAKGAAGLKRDIDAAATWYAQACPADKPADPEGCRELGLLQLKGKGASEDPTAARANFERACFQNDAEACRHLAQLELGAEHFAEAMVAAQRGCDLGDAGACKRLERVQFKMALSNR